MNWQHDGASSMKSSADRFALLLAASGLSERTVYNALREVEVYGAEAFLMRIKNFFRVSVRSI